MNILVAFLGYKSETCLPKSKCLKSMPISIFFGAGKCLGGVHPPPPRKSTPVESQYKLSSFDFPLHIFVLGWKSIDLYKDSQEIC